MIDPIVANNNEIHLSLAQLCIQNRDFTRAKQYVDWLALRLPTEPQVLLLEIAQQGPQAKWDPDVKQFYDKLPEGTTDEKSLKASVAMQQHNAEAAVVLLNKLYAEKPGDVEIAMKLVPQLKSLERVPEAVEVVKVAIEKHPENPMLPEVLKELEGKASNEELDKETLAAIEKNPDPLQRELSLSKYYKMQERPEEELKHLNAALAIVPDNHDVLTNVFMRDLSLRRFPEAQAMLPHCIDVDADDAHGLMLKTKLALAMNDAPTAIAASRQMTRDLANFAGSWELYGEALEASGQLSVACEQFNAALALQATNVDARTHLITDQVRQGKLVEARDNINGACRQFPTDPSYRDMRQRFEINYGDPVSLLPELDAQIAQRPKEMIGFAMEVDALRACVRLKATQNDAGEAKRYQNMAIDRLKQAVAQWPDNIGFANGLAQAYAQSGDMAAAQAAMTAISERPRWKDQPRPLIMLGQILLSQRKFAEAEKPLKQALVAQPDSVEALLNLSDCYLSQSKPDDALAVLYPYVSNLGIRVKYIDVLLQTGHADQAEFNVAQALKDQPNNSALTNLMLEVLTAENKRDAGVKFATDSIASDRTNIYPYFWRAKLLLQGANPDLENASKDLNHFLDAVPNDANSHFMMARILDEKADRDGAIRELEAAMKFSPDDRSIRLYLANNYLKSNPPRNVDAERLLQSSLALPSMSNDPELLAQLAMVQAQKGDSSAAVKTMQAAMATNPANKKALIGPYFNLLLLTKSYDLLMSESDALVTDPSSPWFVYNDRAVAMAKLGDPAGAMLEFTKAMDLANAQPGRTAPLAVARAVVDCDNLGQAKALEMVLPRAKNSTLWQLVAIELMVAKNDIPNAEKQADETIASIDQLKEQADQLRLLELTSNLYLSTSPPQVDKALELYRRRVQLQPNDISAMNDIACILIDMSTPPKPTEALKFSKQAYDLCKSTGQMQTRIADTYGWVLIQTGNVNEGLNVLHLAIDQVDFAEGHYHLGMGYLKKKEFAAAQQEMYTALTMLQKSKDKHDQIDETLAPKIDAALKQISDTSQAKGVGSAASSGQ